MISKTEWLNKHNGKAIDPTTVPRGRNHWTNRVSVTERNYWITKIHHAAADKMPSGNDHWTSKNNEAGTNHRIRMQGDKNPNNLPEVAREKSERMRGLSNPVNSAKVREKIRETLTGYKSPRVICSNCGRNIGKSVFTRYHSNKCRFK